MYLLDVVSALGDIGFDVQLQPSLGQNHRPDLLLVSPDGERVIVVEIKDNVFTADVAFINSVVNEEKTVHPATEGMIIYSSHAPQNVQAMATDRGIKIIHGIKNAKAELLRTRPQSQSAQ